MQMENEQEFLDRMGKSIDGSRLIFNRPINASERAAHRLIFVLESLQLDLNAKCRRNPVAMLPDYMVDLMKSTQEQVRAIIPHAAALPQITSNNVTAAEALLMAVEYRQALIDYCVDFLGENRYHLSTWFDSQKNYSN
jgi:hypothetical protein